MILSLAENSAELQPQLALNLQSSVPLCEASSWHKLVVFKHFEALFQVLSTFFKHAKLLKAHSYVVEGDKCDVLVSGRSFKVYNFQDSLSFLQQYKRLLELFPDSKVVGCVRKFGENDRDLVLVYFDLLVVHRVKRVLVFSTTLCCVSGWFPRDDRVSLHTWCW